MWPSLTASPDYYYGLPRRQWRLAKTSVLDFLSTLYTLHFTLYTLILPVLAVIIPIKVMEVRRLHNIVICPMSVPHI